MRIALRYTGLQFKRSLFTLWQSVCVLLIIAFLFSGISYGVYNILKVKDISLINVGLVVPDDEITTKYVADVISSMESVKSICRFTYVSIDEAKEKYDLGELSAVVVLPQGFYKDVQVGKNPPAIIYIREKNNIFIDAFRELLVSGVSYLQIAESGVYATLDVVREYDVNVEESQIGNKVALLYLNEIFSRDKIFKNKELSVFSSLSIGAYYSIAIFIIIMMFSGIVFHKMYSDSNRNLDIMLKIHGINYFWASIIKIIVMIPILYALSIVFFEIIVWIDKALMIKGVDNSPNMYLALLVIVITLAIYFQIIYGISKKGKTGIFVLSIINIIGAVCSGIIIPSAYMASWVNKVGNIMPMQYWMRIMSLALTGKWEGTL